MIGESQSSLSCGQYYWLSTEDGDFYTAAKLTSDDALVVEAVANSSLMLSFEAYESGKTIRSPADKVISAIPHPAPSILQKSVEDLVSALDISEPAILWNIRKRFRKDEIYSSIGPILVAVNPYKIISGLYEASTLARYSNLNLHEELPSYYNDPAHIWTIARNTYIQLHSSSRRQAIIISGESGAGKTETTKHCLQYLSTVSLSSSKHAGHDAIEIKVLKTNPLLESFGNAKTARNNNSSRFGKWLEIRFRRLSSADFGALELIGAHVTQYLLEKSRVVSQATEERNYHIFYQMCASSEFDLKPASEYAFLGQAGAVTIPGVDDGEEFQATQQAIADLQFSGEDRSMIFDSLKAILIMGNIAFENGDTAKITEASKALVIESAALLGLTPAELESAFLSKRLEIRGEKMNVTLSETGASDTRNAFCKEIYGRLFSQITHQANKSLSVGSELDESVAANSAKNLCIGLLDIFGFEIFNKNSFEQLCINYGNEKLQQYFIDYVLKKEQEIYLSEGLEFDQINHLDNEDVLAMIESRQGGVFALLDEELKLPKCTDLTFLAKVEKEHNNKPNGRFKRDFRMKAELFEIRHFAGTVTYDVTNFLEKNRDKMHDYLEDLIQSSLRSRFAETMLLHGPRVGANAPIATPGKPSGRASMTGGSAQSATIVSRFSKQLNDLMVLLGMSEPHFVKCIKPNNSKRPEELDIELTLRQLRYSGVLEAIKIRKNGYPMRLSHREFKRMNWVLSGIDKTTLFAMSDYEACRAVLDALAAKNPVYTDIKFGRTLVFYRPEAGSALENERYSMGLKALIFLQSKSRQLKAKARVKELNSARHKLKQQIALGEQRNKCNFAVIPTLAKAIEECNAIGMICFVIKTANQLLERLNCVKTCNDRVVAEMGRAKITADIVQTSRDLDAIVKEATDLDISTESVRAAQSYIKEIATRVTTVLNLREALELRDGERIKTSLAAVDELVQKHGRFCVAEETQARDILVRLERQVAQVKDCLQLARIKFIDPENLAKIVSGSAQPSKESLESNGQFIRSLEVLESLELDAGPISTILSLMKSMVFVRKHLYEADWMAVATGMRQINDDCNRYSSAELAKLSQKYLDLLMTAFETARSEVDLIAQELDTNYFLPKLSVCFENGSLESYTSEAQNAKLKAAVKDVRSIGWMGTSMKTILPVVDALIAVRSAVVLEDPELVLALTEDPETTQVRNNRRLKMADILSGEAIMQEHSHIMMEPILDRGPIIAENRAALKVSIIAERGPLPDPEVGSKASKNKMRPPPPPPGGKAKPPPPPASSSSSTSSSSTAAEEKPGGASATTLFVPIEADILRDRKSIREIEEIKTSLSANFAEFFQMLSKELNRVRESALEHYAQALLCDTIKFGAIQGTLEKLDTSKGSSKGLAKAVEEVDFTLSGKTIVDPVLPAIRDYCTKITKLRSLLLNKSLDVIVNLHLEGGLATMPVPASMIRTPLVRQFFVLAKYEMRLIVSEAVSSFFMKTLEDSFSNGRIHGEPGAISVKDIAYRDLENTQSIIHSLRDLNGEHIMMSEKFTSMVDFARSVVQLRKSFQLDGLGIQRETFNALVSKFPHIPVCAQAEMTLVRQHITLEDLILALTNALTAKKPFSYYNADKLIGAEDSYRVTISQDPSKSSRRNLNLKVLDVSHLHSLLDRCEVYLGESPYPTPKALDNLIVAAKHISSIREHVAARRWNDADTVLGQLRSEDIESLVPSISVELQACTEVVDIEIVIMACEVALTSDGLKATADDVGCIDVSVISNEKTKLAVSLCESRGCKTRDASVLFKAVQFIKELRDAALHFDLDKTRSLLDTAAREGLEAQFPDIVLNEMSVARVLVLNEDYSNQILGLVAKGAIKLINGVLDVASIDTEPLREMLDSVSRVREAWRGRKLKMVIEIATALHLLRASTRNNMWDVIAKKIDTLNKSVSDLIEFVAQKQREGRSAHLAFEESIHIIQDECKVLNDLVAMHLFESDAIKELSQNGLTSSKIGNTSSAGIDPAPMQALLDRLDRMKKVSSVAVLPALISLGATMQLVHDIRESIVHGHWENVEKLVNRSTTSDMYSSFPEVTKKEIQAVKDELYNRDIIARLTNALLVGRLEGSVENADFGTLGCRTLDAEIQECKLAVLKTDEASCLLYSAMQVLRVRQFALENPTPWGKLKTHISGLLVPQQLSKLHPTCLPEIELIYQVVLDHLLCTAMKDAIIAGSVSGTPGNLNCSRVTSSALIASIEDVSLTQLKTSRSVQYYGCASLVLRLREILKDVYSDPPVGNVDAAWLKVNEILAEFQKIRAQNPQDAGWAVCKGEIMLISREAHIQDSLRILRDGVTASCNKFDSYNQSWVSVGAKREGSDFTMELLSNLDLDTIIKACTAKSDCMSPHMEKLLIGVYSLRTLRSQINRCEWVQVKELTKSPDLQAFIQLAPFVADEVKRAYQHAHNKEIIDLIEKVLARPYKFSLSLSHEEADLALEAESLLEQAIKKADSATITSAFAESSLACAKLLYQLRWNVRNYETERFKELVKWFRSNSNSFPPSALEEVNLTEVLYYSAIAVKDIFDALSRGAATMKGGQLDVSVVETEELQRAVTSAENIENPSDDLRNTIRIANMIIELRIAQRNRDEGGVTIVIDRIASSNFNIPSIAVVEVSVARADVGNKAAIAIMTSALASFRSDEASSGVMRSASEDGAALEGGAKPKKSVRMTVAPTSSKALAIAIQQAESRGIFSDEAKRLRKTAVFVLALRRAIEADDWFRVDELLAEYDRVHRSRRRSIAIAPGIEDVAVKEIKFVRVQLHAMSSVVELQKLLRSGWATCCNGIVDVSDVEVEPLEDAIKRVELSIFELDEMNAYRHETASVHHAVMGSADAMDDDPDGAAHGGEVEVGDPYRSAGKQIKKDTLGRLVSGAKEILAIRNFLMAGEINSASTHAERTLNSKPHSIIIPELQLYYVEIGRALHMMRLCRSLRGSMRLGNVEALETSIFEAQQASLQHSGDLGLLRTLEKAMTLHASIIKTHNHLRALVSGFDVAAIESALEHCKQLNMSGNLVEKVHKRLALLQRFEKSVADITSKINLNTSAIEVQELVHQLAVSSKLEDHPVALRCKVLMRLSERSLNTALVAEAMFTGNVLLAACATVRIRQQALSREICGDMYDLENFPGFREPTEFASRMMLVSQDLLQTMLVHTESPIPTSLTRLSPVLAALAVWIFRHCIQALEGNLYSHPEVNLRNLVALGRFSLPMRTEILAQIVKQLRENSNEDEACIRLWVVLITCLEHFPPSMEFEPYLETFFHDELNFSTNPDIAELISQCILKLHCSVFMYGYNRKITSSWNASLKHMATLLNPKTRLAVRVTSNRVKYGVLVESAGSSKARRRSVTGATSLRHSLEAPMTSSPRVSGKRERKGSVTSGARRSPNVAATARTEDSAVSTSDSLLTETDAKANAAVTQQQAALKKKLSRRSSMVVPGGGGAGGVGADGAAKDSSSMDGDIGSSVSIPFITRRPGGASSGGKGTDGLDDDPTAGANTGHRRGTPEDWEARFQLLSRGQSAMGFEAFNNAIRSDGLDPKDKVILQFLMTGSIPQIPMLQRQLAEDSKAFTESDSNEKARSEARKQLVAAACDSIDKKQVAADGSAMRFWNNFVVPLCTRVTSTGVLLRGAPAFGMAVGIPQPTIALTWREYRDIVIGGMNWLWKKK